jgi:uncharacterized protein YjaG (DUF416 family)
MLQFDEVSLVKKLARLASDKQAAFAAACAERMRLGYQSFSATTGRGSLSELDRILERLWNDLQGSPMAPSELRKEIAAALDLVPREDDGAWVTEQAAADDAASGLVYALRCRSTGSPQEAAWAARRAYEALDHWVTNSEKIGDPVDEKKVISHPLIQAELARQQSDLEELEKNNSSFALLRRRAIENASVFFAEPT